MVVIRGALKFNSMTYSSIADKPVINTAKDSDTSVTGTGTPGNSVTVYDASGKKLGTATVKEDGTWSLPVEQGTLKAGEKLTATQKAPGSNRDSEPATGVVTKDNQTLPSKENTQNGTKTPAASQDKIPDSVLNLPQISEKPSNSIYLGFMLLVGALGSLLFRVKKIRSNL
ncbi:Ig-like domain-containing protein [Lactococcus raffinolactis]|uniref:Ig-like domain-containing protein n=1 Tax=Pseudolactococcus raffinolactis TaxID=1366 RepID=UPI000BB49C2A|nr:Ig-like domain-containing protein [Lactococcus raffinolactis]ATC61389.1 hypothetical protein CMV25_05665 [Lactococcus raffinolactis]